MRPAISVVMPVHHVSAHLVHRAVASVARQTAGGLELVVVDDGNENRWRRCFDIPRHVRCNLAIQQIRLNSRRGIACARNAGATQARGRWLMWLDADDWLDATCVQHLLSSADAARLVIGECNIIDGGKVARRIPASVIDSARRLVGTPDDLLMRFIFAIQPQLMRVETFRALGGFNEIYHYAELTELFLRFVSTFGLRNVRLAPCATYNYTRDRPDNVSNQRIALEAYRLRCLAEYCSRAGHPASTIAYVGWSNALGAREYRILR